MVPSYLTSATGMSSRGSHDSTSTSSNLPSISPPTGDSSDGSNASNCDYNSLQPNGFTVEDFDLQPEKIDPLPSSKFSSRSPEDHVIQLSSLEHCMPRAYIRVCLAYRLPDHVPLESVLEKLRKFARRIVDSKPYLAGHVVGVSEPNPYAGLVEVRYTDQDFRAFPQVQERRLTRDEVPYTYDELNEMRLPPSVIRPDLVSALPEGADDQYAPVFRMQANVVSGGLIVSVYLHHCISDGVGLGLLITGSVLQDDFTFDRCLEADDGDVKQSLNQRLEAFANQKSILRQRLSWSFPSKNHNRQIKFKQIPPKPPANSGGRAAGRGCVLQFSKTRLAELKDRLEKEVPNCFMTSNDVLQALLWQHMTIARKPAVCETSITTSKLLIPVNIRNKLEQSLPESYFGAAVDFASAELSLAHLSPYDPTRPSKLAETALAVRHAINQVDEDYVRQAITLARTPDSTIDVRDLMGSNMNRSTGADMYITSWEKLGLYDATLELGLGKPDWVRKPWSKDPGSCIVLPKDDRKSYLEVVVQMTQPDLERLLVDTGFMQFVERTVD